MALLQTVMERIQAAEDNPDVALRLVDEELQKASPTAQRHLKSWKVTILMDQAHRIIETAESVEEVQRLREVSEQLVDLTLDRAAEKEAALLQIASDFADPAAVLEQLRRQREPRN